MTPLTKLHAKHLALASIQMFLVGSLYALGLFNAAVESSAVPPGTLDGVWSSSMALMSLLCTPVMLGTGVWISRGATHAPGELRFLESKTGRVRLLSMLGSASFALLGLAAWGVETVNAGLIQTTVALQGVALGIFYLVGIELLAASTPTHPGFAVGCGQMAFGFGSIVFAAVFNSVLEFYSCSAAVLLSAFLLTIPSLLCSFSLEWPCEPVPGGSDCQELGLPDDEGGGVAGVIVWKSLPFLMQFWCYACTVFAAQAGFAFIPYFFKIGLSFQKPMELLTSCFQGAILVSTLLRPVAGIAADSLKWGQGHFALGSKNMMALVLLFQAISFFTLIPLSSSGNFAGFAITAGLILAVFAAGACGASILARDMFGVVNSSLVFGIGGSISMGLGEYASAALMSLVDSSRTFGTSASKYNSFFFIGAVWSAFGFLSCIVIRRYDENSHAHIGHRRHAARGVSEEMYHPLKPSKRFHFHDYASVPVPIGSSQSNTLAEESVRFVLH